MASVDECESDERAGDGDMGVDTTGVFEFGGVGTGA